MPGRYSLACQCAHPLSVLARAQKICAAAALPLQTKSTSATARSRTTNAWAPTPPRAASSSVRRGTCGCRRSCSCRRCTGMGRLAAALPLRCVSHFALLTPLCSPSPSLVLQLPATHPPSHTLLLARPRRQVLRRWLHPLQRHLLLPSHGGCVGRGSGGAGGRPERSPFLQQGSSAQRAGVGQQLVWRALCMCASALAPFAGSLLLSPLAESLCVLRPLWPPSPARPRRPAAGHAGLACAGQGPLALRRLSRLGGRRGEAREVLLRIQGQALPPMGAPGYLLTLYSLYVGTGWG